MNPLEPRKNTIYDCKNNFTEDEIESRFFSTDSISRICNTCENLVYIDGIMECNKLKK